MPENFSDVIGLWPSAEEFARDLGEPGPKIRMWRDRIRKKGAIIQPSYWNAILEAAQRRGIEGLSLDLFARLAEESGPK